VVDVTGGILLPIAETPTVDQAVEAAVELARTAGDGERLHLVRIVPGQHVGGVPKRDAALLERAEQTAIEADAEDFETAILGTDTYVAGPGDHCEILVEYARSNDLDRIVLDPQYTVDATDPTLQSVESILASYDVDFEYAPVAISGGLTRGELLRASIVAVVAFGFYVALGGPTSTFTLASGVITGLIAGVLLRNVAFETTPTVGVSLQIAVRAVAFVPYLLWEIAKANVLFAYLVLHPSLPIDPRISRFDAAVGNGLSVTTLANSITLTPGTLTLDASGHSLLIHAMTPGAEDDVLDGVLEKAVRFLFYGRAASELPGPRAREEYELLTHAETSTNPTETDEPGENV